MVNKWLGDSGKVAEKHYLQVTDDHWPKASELEMVCDSTRGSISSPAEAITKTHKTTKPSELLGSDGAGWLMIPNLVTPTGVEPVLPP